MSTHELDLIWLLRPKGGKKNKKGKRKGCFGGKKKVFHYNSMKVIPKSKRTKDNCNEYGVAVDKEINSDG